MSSDSTVPTTMAVNNDDNATVNPTGATSSIRNSSPSNSPAKGRRSVSNSGSGNSRKSKRNQTSFTADSPYFTAYVDKEMKNLNVLTSTLRDISSKAKTFGKCGVLMSEATRRLSSACKLQPTTNKENGAETGNFDERSMDSKDRVIFEQKKKSVGNEMVGVLQVLGKVSEKK
jgi:hypothetical protein